MTKIEYFLMKILGFGFMAVKVTYMYNWSIDDKNLSIYDAFKPRATQSLQCPHWYFDT